MSTNLQSTGTPSTPTNSPSTSAARRALDRYRLSGLGALLVIGGLYLLVSGNRIVGPTWLLPGAIAIVAVALLVARIRHAYRMVRWLALGAVSGVTGAVAGSAWLLVVQLLDKNPDARVLLRDAALIWVVNIMTFALWYWEIDGGGPMQRHQHLSPRRDFLFPQMTLDDPASQQWLPQFLDYLFLAFNTSTAFSPTDTLVLSRQAKVLMMLQSLISLVVIAVLAARAINTLPTLQSGWVPMHLEYAYAAPNILHYAWMFVQQRV